MTRAYTLTVLLLLALTATALAAPPPELAHLPHADLVAQIAPPSTPEIPQSGLRTQAIMQPPEAVFVHVANPREISQLRAVARSEQHQLKETMREFAIYETRQDPKHRYNTFNGFTALLTPQEQESLLQNPLVEQITPNHRVTLFMQDSVEIINATSTWQTQIDNQSLTGQGQAVCVIDTGIRYSHQEFGGCSQSQFLAGECKKVPAGINYISGEEENDPFDTDGHGTHVAGSIAANHTYKGVAPDAQLLVVRALSSEGGSLGDVVKGIEWCIDQADTYNVSAISMSLGADGYLTDSFCDSEFPSFAGAIDNATSQGIRVVAAAGNDGSSSQIGSPACIQNATSVASTDKSDDTISSFSNRNALTLLAAPGRSITSAWSTGNSDYNTASGTSMATPHVSGAIAIIDQYLQAVEQEKTSQEIELLLNKTGKPIVDGSLTYQRINILQAIIELSSSPQTTATFPSGWQNSSFNVTLNTTGEIDVEFTSYRLNNQSWQNGTQVSITTSANHTLEFFSESTSGVRESTQVVHPLLDLTPPNTTDDAPSSWRNESVTVTLSASDNFSGISFTSYRIDSQDWINGTSILFNQSSNYTLAYRSTDVAGNQEDIKNTTVLVDLTAPKLLVSTPASWQTSDFVVNWSASANYSGLNRTEYRIDGDSWFEADNVTFSESGNYSLEVRAVDNVGNTNTSTHQVLLDKEAPLTTDDAPSGWSNQPFTVLLNASDGVSGVDFTSYRINSGSWVNATNITIDADGNLTLEYYSVDVAGNQEVTRTTNVALDQQAPTLNVTAPVTWQNEAFNISFTPSDELSGVRNFSIQQADEAPVNSTNITISQQGNTSITLQATDYANNTNQTTIQALLDLTAPTTTSDVPTGWQANPVTVSLSASDNLSGVDYTSYRINSGDWLNGTEVVFNESGNFTLEFFSLDVAGNQENISNASVLIDLDAPVLNVSAPSGWHNETFNVSFTPFDALSGVSSFSIQVDDQTPQNETVVSIAEEGNFSVTFQASDAVNNSNQTTIQALLDLTPPNTSVTVPSGWQNTNVTLVFNASDNLSGVNYTQYRVNGGSWVQASNATFSDGNHSIEYRSVDNAGNFEQIKNASLLIDTIPPTITNFAINNSQPQANESVSLSATIADHNSIVNASLTVAGSTQEVTLVNNSFTQDYQLPLGTYQATLQATDQANNTAQQTLSFTVYEKQSFSQEINDTQLDSKNATRTRLRLKTNQTISANVTILASKDKPSTINKKLPRAIRHSTIQLSQNAKDALEWANLSIGYDEADLEELNASTLRMAYYNQSADEWVNLTSNLSWVHSTGVDTLNQEVWANVTRFSTYAITADEPTPPQPDEEQDSSGSSPNTGSTGGGGGGGAAPATSSNESSRTQTLVQAGDRLTYVFNNPQLAIKRVRFTAQESTSSLTLTLRRETLPANAPVGAEEYYVLEHPAINVEDVTIEYEASEDLVLWRLDGEWQPLPREELTPGVYQATSPGLSEFVLAPQQGEPETAPEQVQPEPINESTPPTLTNQTLEQLQEPELSQPAATRSKTIEIILMGVLAALALLVALATVFERSWNERD